MDEQRSKGIQRVVNAVMCALFVLAIWLPLAALVLPIEPDIEVSEYRLMAQFPRFQPSFDGVLEYPKGFEAWWQDHFGYRSTLVHYFSLMRSKIPGFRVGNTVIAGKDGWFYTIDEETIEDYRGKYVLTPEELELAKAVLEERRDWMAEFGVHYIFTVPPAKWAVYPEYLPDHIRVAEEHSIWRQLREYLEKNSDIEIVDLKNLLLDAKQKFRVFYRTDTHWTKLGAFVATLELQRKLAETYPSIEVDALENYEVQEFKYIWGDLARVMGLRGSVWETGFRLKRVAPRDKLVKLEGDPTLKFAFYEKPSLKGRGLKLMMLYDSFGARMPEFFAHSFAEARFYRSPPDPELIAGERPDVLIQEKGQRVIAGTVYSNPPGIAGFRLPVEGKYARVDYPPGNGDVSFYCRSLSEVAGKQYITLEVNGRPIGEWRIDQSDQLISAVAPEVAEPAASLKYALTYRYQLDEPSVFEGVELPFDLTAATGGDDANFIEVGINGSYLPAGKGYNLYRINGRGELTAYGTFNTSWNEEESARLIDFIEANKRGRGYMLVVSNYLAGRRLTEDAVRALRSLGLRKQMRNRTVLNHIALVDMRGRNAITEKMGTGQQSLDVGDYGTESGFRMSGFRTRPRQDQ